MRAIVLVVAAVLLCGAAAQSVPLGPAQKAAIAATNLHHVEKLDPLPRKCITDFLDEVQQHDTVIQLGNAIAGGHSVHYEVLSSSNPGIVAQIARKHKLTVVPSSTCKAKTACGRIVLPGKDVKIVEAEESGGKRQLRANPAAAAEAKKPLAPLSSRNNKHDILTQEAEDKGRLAKLNKLDDAHKQWYHDNNLHQVSLMNAEAQPFVKKFIEDLREKAPNTVIHLMAPPRDGYSVRFTHVEGDVGAILKQVATACGLKVDGMMLIAPKGTPQTAEGSGNGDSKAHIVVDTPEQSDAGAPDPVKKVGRKKRNVVKSLPDKWIEAEPKPAAPAAPAKKAASLLEVRLARK